MKQAFDEYFTTVAEYNRAQFELFHALGYPAREITYVRPPGTVEPVDTTRPDYLAPGRQWAAPGNPLKSRYSRPHPGLAMHRSRAARDSRSRLSRSSLAERHPIRRVSPTSRSNCAPTDGCVELPIALCAVRRSNRRAFIHAPSLDREIPS